MENTVILLIVCAVCFALFVMFRGPMDTGWPIYADLFCSSAWGVVVLVSLFEL